MPRLHVVTRLSDYTTIPEVAIGIQSIITAVSGETDLFPALDPAVAVVKADLDKLLYLEGQVDAGFPMTVARDQQLELLMGHIESWRSYVEKVANANPGSGAVIIAAAGMYMRVSTPRQPLGYGVKQGKLSGTAVLTAPALPGGRGIQRWHVSTNGKDYVLATEDNKAIVTLKDLAPGVLHYFRHQTVIGSVTSDWHSVPNLFVT